VGASRRVDHHAAWAPPRPRQDQLRPLGPAQPPRDDLRPRPQAACGGPRQDGPVPRDFTEVSPLARSVPSSALDAVFDGRVPVGEAPCLRSEYLLG
jgi:hypothetical protein